MTQHSVIGHPSVASPEWIDLRSQQALYRCSQHRFLAPNVEPERLEHARATVIVVVPALLAQVLLPVSRQSPFPRWILVPAPCFCFCLCLCFSRGRCGSSAGCKRPACHRSLSNPRGTVHVFCPSRYRGDISNVNDSFHTARVASAEIDN
jgi:hypothetical protein